MGHEKKNNHLCKHADLPFVLLKKGAKTRTDADPAAAASDLGTFSKPLPRRGDRSNELAKERAEKEALAKQLAEAKRMCECLQKGVEFVPEETAVEETPPENRIDETKLRANLKQFKNDLASLLKNLEPDEDDRAYKEILSRRIAATEAQLDAVKTPWKRKKELNDAIKQG
jgi:hypothetical protein